MWSRIFYTGNYTGTNKIIFRVTCQVGCGAKSYIIWMSWIMYCTMRKTYILTSNCNKEKLILMFVARQHLFLCCFMFWWEFNTWNSSMFIWSYFLGSFGIITKTILLVMITIISSKHRWWSWITSLYIRNWSFQLTVELFTNVSQYKNASIANFVLAVPLENNCTTEVYKPEMQLSHTHWYIISHLLTS